MDNPCLKCHRHLTGKSKSDIECTQCDARIAYVRFIGSNDSIRRISIEPTGSSPSPKLKTQQKTITGDAVVENMVQPSETDCEAQQKRCPQCKELFDPTEVNFYRHPKTPDGLSIICRWCHGENISIRKNIAKLKKQTGKKVKPETVATVPLQPPVKNKPPRKYVFPEIPQAKQKMVLVDFNDHEDLLQALHDMASTQLRTPELMVLALIRDRMTSNGRPAER